MSCSGVENGEDGSLLSQNSIQKRKKKKSNCALFFHLSSVLWFFLVENSHCSHIELLAEFSHWTKKKHKHKKFHTSWMIRWIEIHQI